MTTPCTESERLSRIDKNVERVVRILDGNGDEGLKTKVALNKQSINRLWWWIGGISLALVAGLVKLLI